jgi:hypothetical protein
MKATRAHHVSHVADFEIELQAKGKALPRYSHS